MKKKLNIELDITKIWAENGYLGFEYKTFVNNKLVKSGYYESDYVWNDSEMKQQLKKILGNRVAIITVPEDVSFFDNEHTLVFDSIHHSLIEIVTAIKDKWNFGSDIFSRMPVEYC